MIIDEDDYLAHYGTPRHSGRYPWGSGGHDAPPQRNPSFLDQVRELKRQGLTDVEIVKGLGLKSTTQLRAKRTIAINEERQEKIAIAQSLKDKGMAGTKAAAQMGIPEATYRALLEPGAKERADVLINTANMLKEHTDAAWANSSPLDIGSGVEAHVPVGEGLNIGIADTKLKAAVAILEEQGYMVHEVPVPQVSNKFDTKTKVLVPPGVSQKEAWQNRFNIKQITSFSPDGGKRWGRVDHPPISVNPNRVQIRYKEDGGAQADGVIYVREGAKDLTLGKNRYAQVRILVGENHYLKGMAIYKDDLPKGTDLVFNTNKSSTGNKFDAMKPIEDNQDYPFGSVVRQIVADEGTSQERNISAMNLVNEQGDWAKWSRTLSSQMLSKQSPRLAKQQLDMTFEQRQQEFDEINSLTNPTVKKVLLEKFADATDSAAVHLRAASVNRANWHAILPVESMSPTEVYAPNYNDGENVILIRYPHGGTFEIPKLTVNNRNPEAKKLIGDGAIDAIGINHIVAQQLSGADFDGDTVLVIPNNSGKFKSAPPIDSLKDFDPKSTYGPYDGMVTIDGGTYNASTDKVEFGGKPPNSNRKQQEMGNISNLITDMTLKLAPQEQLVRAIKHSMVVIDSEKHHLDYRLSAKRNGISALKAEYQGGANRGASTLISRKGKEDRNQLDRKLRPQSEGGPVDRATGRKVFVLTDKKRRNRNGELVPKTTTVKLLAETHDAHTLTSGPPPTPMEKLYADHSNKLKDLANKSRLKALDTPLLKYSPSANKIYKDEVKSLDSKLSLVIANRPRERHAQAVAQGIIKAKYEANPHLDEGAKKKIRFQEQERARIRFGAKGERVYIEDKEWNAIQAGAISDNKLSQILKKADIDRVKELATPRHVVLMTPTKTIRAKSMLASGASRAEVAAALGVSLTTLDNATVGGE